jgi:hypothetical protein
MQKLEAVFVRSALLTVMILSTVLGAGAATFHCGALSETMQLLVQDQQAPPAEPALPPAPNEEKLDLSDQVIRDVFTPLQEGMQGHNLDQVLATFDDQQMPDYAVVRDQLRAFFDQYDAIRFRYQLLQVTSDKSGASAVAEIQIEATPADESQMTARREAQMRFRLARVSKGWKVAGFSPADFFAQ